MVAIVNTHLSAQIGRLSIVYLPWQDDRQNNFLLPQSSQVDLQPYLADAAALPSPSIARSIYTADLGTDRATADTIAIMASLARQGARSNEVYWAVEQAWYGLPADASDREITKAIYNWVRRTVRFVEDESLIQLWTGEVVTNKELLIAPERLLTMQPPQGDCDDFSTLLAAMLLSVGIPTSFVTIAADSFNPGRFSHVYVRASLARGEVVNLDASHGTYLGWESPEKFREVEWPI